MSRIIWFLRPLWQIIMDFLKVFQEHFFMDHLTNNLIGFEFFPRLSKKKLRIFLKGFKKMFSKICWRTIVKFLGTFFKDILTTNIEALCFKKIAKCSNCKPHQGAWFMGLLYIDNGFLWTQGPSKHLYLSSVSQ